MIPQADLSRLSCFPIVPKLACKHLGLSTTKPAKPITLLGGLTSFGGAGNNYSMHAVTEMTRQLRRGNGKNGLILANGGVVTYQHVICLSREPRRNGSSYPASKPLPPLITDVHVPTVDAKAQGDATIEVSCHSIFSDILRPLTLCRRILWCLTETAVQRKGILSAVSSPTTTASLPITPMRRP